jgi:hypothetical protein
MDGRFQLRQQRAHDVFHGRQSSPRLRRAPHVIQDQTGVAVHDDLCQLGLPRQRRDIVDNDGTVLERLLGNFHLVGVDRDGNRQPSLQLLQHRHEPPQFLASVYALRPRSRRLGADVDDVCSLTLHLHGASHGRVRICEVAAIGERVGRDVQDAHDQCAFAEREFVVPGFEGYACAVHSYLRQVIGSRLAARFAG